MVHVAPGEGPRALGMWISPQHKCQPVNQPASFWQGTLSIDGVPENQHYRYHAQQPVDSVRRQPRQTKSTAPDLP